MVLRLSLMAAPDKGIHRDLLAKAHWAVILPSMMNESGANKPIKREFTPGGKGAAMAGTSQRRPLPHVWSIL